MGLATRQCKYFNRKKKLNERYALMQRGRMKVARVLSKSVNVRKREKVTNSSVTSINNEKYLCPMHRFALFFPFF